VTAARHCSRRDNRIGCFVGDNRARGLHANERVAPLNTSNAYIRAYLAPLSGAQTRSASRARGILDRVIDIYPSGHAHAHAHALGAIFSRRYPRDRAAMSNIVVFNSCSLRLKQPLRAVPRSSLSAYRNTSPMRKAISSPLCISAHAKCRHRLYYARKRRLAATRRWFLFCNKKNTRSLHLAAMHINVD